MNRVATLFGPNLESGEAFDGDFFAGPGNDFVKVVGNGLVRLLDVLLVQQTVFLEEFIHLALGDLFDHLFRLAHFDHLGAVDLALPVDDRLGNILGGDPHRIGGRDMHGDVSGEFAEVVGFGHEIGFAVHFHHDADLAAHVDVGLHRALGSGPARPLGGGGDAFLTQKVHRFFKVALTFDQRGLAVHHARAGFFTEFFYFCCTDICHLNHSPVRYA
ncbi:hypothetical protein DESC_820016 [Desulfosarcina cetonica]|nr:hypothetical protein DESC_820016 [Desulfosarcina cetonica]